MGQGRGADCQIPDALRGDKGDGGDPHDGAATFRVVPGRFSEPGRGKQGCQAGRTRRTARMEALVPDQPGIIDRHLWPFRLRRQPAQQGMVHHRRRVAHAPLVPAHGCANQPFRNEQRHLGIVGDGAADALVVGQIHAWVEAGADHLQRAELQIGAKRIADCAAQQAGQQH